MKWSGIPKILVNEIAHTTFLFREETSSRNSSQTTKFREQGREEGFAHTLHCLSEFPLKPGNFIFPVTAAARLCCCCCCCCCYYLSQNLQ